MRRVYLARSARPGAMAVFATALALALSACSSTEENPGVDQGGQPPEQDAALEEDGGVVLADGPSTTACGNAKIDPNEDCDGASLNDMTCQALGYTGGTLKCGTDCAFDKSGCTGTPAGPVFGQRCGGDLGKCAGDLICVIANEAGKDVGFCTPECGDTKPCPTLPKGATCAFQLEGGKTVCGFLCSADNPICPPDLTCVADPNGDYYCSTDDPTQCGNSKIEAGEECEGQNFGGQTCEALGFTGGSLKCSASCKLDSSGCTGTPAGGGFGTVCGQGIATCQPNLTCLLVNMAGEKKGYCSPKCAAGVACPTSPAGSECVAIDDAGNQFCVFFCDSGSCPNGLTCTTLDSGQKICSTDAPPVCGNNKIEGAEECDGTALNNMGCTSFGYASGTLKCTACKYDQSACQGQSTCNLPPLNCTAGNAACSKLEQFAPSQGDGYLVGHPLEWSWLRHDTAMIIKYAAAAVACLMPGSLPVHTFDMSMKDGTIPKSDAYGKPCYTASATCQERHPTGTHVYGVDIDMSYYQTQGMQNPGPVCPHTTGGVDQYHCVAPPTILDTPRTTLFIGKALESTRIRVIGVDGQIGPLVVAEAKKLAAQGLISSTALSRFNKLAYETTNQGMGWYQFHHHHFHMSTTNAAYSTPAMPPPVEPVPEAADPYASVDPMQLTIVHPAACLGKPVLQTAPLLQLDPYDSHGLPHLRLETWSPR
jgi:hypothetical protein